MEIIAVGNNKGGIAKTTTALHLSAYLAEEGYKVLVIDSDPQTNLSIGFKIPEDYPYTILDLLNGEPNFRVTMKGTNLYVLAGSKLLDSETRDIYILKERLEQLNNLAIANNQKPFDFVIIDLPPELLTKKMYHPKKGDSVHIPKVNEIAAAAADYFMVPVHAEKYSMDGLQTMLASIIKFRSEFNPGLNVLGVFFTMVLKNERDFKEHYKIVKQSIPEEYFFDNGS